MALMNSMILMTLLDLLVQADGAEVTDALRLPIDDIIPGNYNTYARAPGIFPEWRTIVLVNCLVLYVGVIDSKNMTYSLQWSLRAVWSEPRFMDMVGRQLIVGAEEVYRKMWTPIFTIDNEKHSEVSSLTGRNVLVAINSNKQVFMFMRMTSTLACNLDLTMFPMDTQRCYLTIECWNYNDSEVSLVWTNLSLQSAVELKEGLQITGFRLKSVRYWNYTSLRFSLGTFSTLSAEFLFQREFNSFILNTYFCSSILVFVSWITFWLDIREISSRIQLGITMILTIITHAKTTTASITKVGYLKIVDIWNVFTTIFVILAFFESAVAYRLFKNYQLQEQKKPRSQYVETDDHSLSLKLDKYSRIVFPCLFFVFSVVYWIYCAIQI